MSRTARSLPAVLLGLALLAASSMAPVAAAGTSVVTEISNATANENRYMNAFDAPAAGVGDFNKDGVKEIVAFNDNQLLYVIATNRPHIYAEIRPDYPANWGVRPINDPAVADVDNDGNLDVVSANSAGIVCVHEYDPGQSTRDRFTFHRRWCDRMDDFGTLAADSGVIVEDVDGDGRMEIFAQTEEVGLFAWNHDGSVRWKVGTVGGNAGPVVADLDGDGRKEAIYFGDGGEVKAFDASQGWQKWSFFASAYVWPASIPIAGNAGDVDGDGKKEVVFVARDSKDKTNFANNHFMLFVLGFNGALKWRTQPAWGNPMSYTRPVFLDVNGDGKRDILLQDWNTQGHKPGNWEKTGPANVFAYAGNGALLWRTVLDNSWSNDDLAVADVDGDGIQEVLAIGFGPGGDGIWYLDARTGAKEQHVAVGPWIILRGPIAGNLGGTGKTWWAVPMHDSGKGGAWKVFRTDASCSVAHGGWQHRDPCGFGGGGGGGGGGSPPPPPPSGAFDATFTTNGGNDWWVAAKVTANHGIAAVDARVNGGAWKPLTLQSWGEWAASFHVPGGSQAQFQARSTAGATDLSGCFVWPQGASASCSGGGAPPPPSGGGGFDASFTNPRGNDWWVEVDVGASGGTLAGVDARVNNGAWTALTKQSWGSWAKSLHAPPGSTVQFQARSTTGATDSSGCYAWTSATQTTCSGGGAPPPSGGSFKATFANARGNDWWVEVDVSTSGGTLSGVDARVNGGAWQGLTKQSWGSWAKSIHAPPGSKVEFVAKAADGQRSQSGAFGWPP